MKAGGIIIMQRLGPDASLELLIKNPNLYKRKNLKTGFTKPNQTMKSNFRKSWKP